MGPVQHGNARSGYSSDRYASGPCVCSMAMPGLGTPVTMTIINVPGPSSHAPPSDGWRGPGGGIQMN